MMLTDLPNPPHKFIPAWFKSPVPTGVTATFNRTKGRETPDTIQNLIFLQQKNLVFGASSTYATGIMSTYGLLYRPQHHTKPPWQKKGVKKVDNLHWVEKKAENAPHHHHDPSMGLSTMSGFVQPSGWKETSWAWSGQKLSSLICRLSSPPLWK